MPETHESVLGDLAVARGLISHDQLHDALQETERAEAKLPLDVVLVERGWLHYGQVEDLHRAGREALARIAHRTANRAWTWRLARRVVQLGYADVGQVNRALREQAQRGLSSGRWTPLGEVLVEQGALTREQAVEALRLQGPDPAAAEEERIPDDRPGVKPEPVIARAGGKSGKPRTRREVDEAEGAPVAASAGSVAVSAGPVAAKAGLETAKAEPEGAKVDPEAAKVDLVAASLDPMAAMVEVVAASVDPLAARAELVAASADLMTVHDGPQSANDDSLTANDASLSATDVSLSASDVSLSASDVSQSAAEPLPASVAVFPVTPAPGPAPAGPILAPARATSAAAVVAPVPLASALSAVAESRTLPSPPPLPDFSASRRFTVELLFLIALTAFAAFYLQRTRAQAAAATAGALQRLDRVIAACSARLATDPGLVPLRVVRGTAFYERATLQRSDAKLRPSDLTQARQDLDVALGAVPSDADARRRRGLVLHALGDWDDAAADFAEAARLEPAREAEFRAEWAEARAKSGPSRPR